MVEPRPPRRFTRSRRRLVFGVLIGLGWIPAQLLIWGARAETYVANSAPASGPTTPTTTIGTRTTTFGLFRYATRTTTNAVLGATPPPGSPAPDSTWDVHALRVASSTFVALTLVVVAIHMVRVLSRLGTLVGHCDACGYDLVAVTSARCPECGTPVPHSDAS